MEKLQRAAADEEYEQAAKLRDPIPALSIQQERKASDIKVKPHDRLESNEEEGANDNV
jgi:excinuclease UvrABC nuclease subunit